MQVHKATVQPRVQALSARRCGRVTVHACSTAVPVAQGPNSVVTFTEVQKAAVSRGLHIGVKDLGPFYRVVCREGNENGKIWAVTSGFVVPPLKFMHCDTLQIFTKGVRGDEGDRVRGGPLGLGLLLGAATFSWGYERGCRKAEILAINDDDSTHARLVRYYRYFGFKPVYQVEGDKPGDIPHLLVWGGVGTRMDADMEAMLQRWSSAVRAAGCHHESATSNSEA